MRFRRRGLAGRGAIFGSFAAATADVGGRTVAAGAGAGRDAASARASDVGFWSVDASMTPMPNAATQKSSPMTRG